jgi:hypothetical protein
MNNIQRDDRTDEFLDEIYPAVTIGECEYLASTILFECDPIHYRQVQCDLEPIESQDGSLGQHENDLFLARFLDDNVQAQDNQIWVDLVNRAYSEVIETEFDPSDVVSDMESEAENNGYRIEWNDGIEIFED